MLNSFVAFGAILESKKSMEATVMGQLHVDLCEAGEMGSAKVAAPMETEGPLSQVPLSDGHPDMVDVTEEPNGTEASLRGRPRLGDKGDDGGADGLGPGAKGLPPVVTTGKGVEPSVREGSEFLRPPTIRTVGLAGSEVTDDLTDLSTRNGREGVVELWNPRLAPTP